MMLRYSELSKHESEFKLFTGLSVDEFDSLYTRVESRYNKIKRKGAGRPFKLSLKNRLLMLLVYYRLYITSRLAGYLFGLDHANVLRNVHRLEPIVRECIPLPRKIHENVRRLNNLDDVERYFPGFKAFIDATEQEIPRPRDKRRRRKYYSGKRKRHTVKTQITVNENGLIIHKSRHFVGRRHDYNMYKHSSPRLPPNIMRIMDLGYYGIEDDYPNLNFMLPYKRGKGGTLTDTEKLFNKMLSKMRIVVEHVICRMKKYKIFGLRYRNRLRYYDLMTDIVSGLVNMRIIGMNI